MDIPPNNRQLKLLRLFGVPTAGISGGEARQAIHSIWADPASQERWNRYVYLTGDLGSESADLKPFDRDALESVVVPHGWNVAAAEREHREKIAKEILKGQPPYDVPPPAVVFRDRVFCFTGRFAYGTRIRCEQAVVERAGLVLDSGPVTHVVDYLVVGAKGSDRWKWGDYGAKIEAAVVERAVHGRPAIIAEVHWCSFL